MPLRHALLIASRWLCLATLACFAAAAPAAPVLTLEQAISRSMERNLGVRAAGQDVDRAAGAEAQAARQTPSDTGVDISAGRRDDPGGESTDFFLSFAQQVWIGGERGLRMKAARERRSAAEAELEYRRTATAASAREAYFDLLIAERAVETAVQLVAVAGRIVTLNEQRLRLGEGTRMQVNAAAVGAARARATLAEAERRVVQARLRLNLLLGEAPSHEFVTEGRLQPAPVPLRQADQLVQLALERRADLQAAAERVAARRSEQRLAQKLLIPEPTFYGYYEQEQESEILGAGVSLPLPLLYQYEGEQRIAAAELAREKTERELLQLQVEQQVLGALADYRAAALQVEAVGEAMLEAALENVQLVQRAVAAGKFAAPALTSAQDNYLSVRETYLDALRALAAAGSALERTTGGLVALEARRAPPVPAAMPDRISPWQADHGE